MNPYTVYFHNTERQEYDSYTYIAKDASKGEANRALESLGIDTGDITGVNVYPLMLADADGNMYDITITKRSETGEADAT